MNSTQINALKRIASDAGAIVREGFHAAKNITHKGTVDLVTQYDVASEQFILNALAQEFSEYTLVGEESHQGSFSQPFERAIYIDPIDGTTNFVHGVPHTAVSIGLYEAGVARMAVVYNPILDELFWAVAGQGAFLSQGAHTTSLKASVQTELQQALIATGFPYTKGAQGEDFEWIMRSMRHVLPRCRDLRRLGSAALDLCYVARGTFEAYYELGLKPWDYAAGVLITQESGALISDVRGSPISFSDNTVLAANPQIHAQLCSLLNAHSVD